MITVSESISIARPIDIVFGIVSNIELVPNLSEHISEFTIAKITRDTLGSKFSLKRQIHGIKYHQEFEVTRYQRDFLYETKTCLFGFEVVYTYKLFETTNDTMKLSLEKKASATGFIQTISPLLKHVFSKPEHDAHHLEIIRLYTENIRS